MKKLVFILMAMASISLARCEKFDTHQWMPFTIQQGKHYPDKIFINRIPSRDGCYTELNFQFYFPDTSYIYDIGDNQSDWNKLFGITPFVNTIHEYSIRVVWRWFNNKLQIGYYIYMPESPKVIKGVITTTSRDIINDATIMVWDNMIVIRVNEDDFTYFDGKSCPGWWTSMPYFGGDEVAPHDIHISLKCKYLSQCLTIK